MKIALIGATGYVGSALLAELLARGHQVTALVRHPEKLTVQAGLTAKKVDVLSLNELTNQLKGHDAVISAYNGFAANVPDAVAHDQFIKATNNIIEATRNAGISRLLMVGGAGSLKVAPDLDLLDTPVFPAQWKNMAIAARAALNIIRNERELDWTFLSPSANLKPGERTAKFRLGLDNLLVAENGESEISTQDYAVAMVNELEQPKHSRTRFTVGY